MSSTQTGVCLVVHYNLESHEQGLTATLNSIKTLQPKEEEEELKERMRLNTVLIWNSTGSKLPLHLDQLQGKAPFYVSIDVEKGCSFFSDISFSLLSLKEHLPQPALAVLHCEVGVIFKSSFLSFLHDKCSEYDFYSGQVAFTAAGYKIFPHPKEHESFQNGVHFKSYSESLSDRAVHLLTPSLCLLNMATLHSIIEKGSGYQIKNSNHFWMSFIIASKLDGSIWKLNTNEHLCLSNSSQPNLSLQDQKFKNFYDTIYSLDWPIGISRPFYAKESMTTPTNNPSVGDIWTRGFGGVNMSSEPASTLDFKAVASYGCRVIRIGAVADAKDLNYLLNSSTTSHYEDSQHLNTVLPRLRQALIRIGGCGLKSIITMTDLPGGCTFQSKADNTFWISAQARERAALFWGQLAKGLSDLSKDLIAGYDLINEPYEPMNPGYFDDITCKYGSELNHFYNMTHEAIRAHDETVVIILAPLSFASPRAMKCLSPIPEDPNVAYSFHMYAPPNLTLCSSRDSECCYPGSVRRWPNCKDELIKVTFEFLYDLLKENVYKWQVENNVPSNRILVGEFGISREVKGSQNYLKDLLKIFTEFGWNWLLFSFRDDEWDALDYELGPDINNMLHRSPTELFLTVSEQFH
uniref:Glycoside hydrolase family 5 domain-containing protein n=1 Tax=Amphimedon queenslandica TaxID=400682 RepID=A0A1X7U131_AMPQE